MIKEISKPLPTITEHLSERKRKAQEKRKIAGPKDVNDYVKFKRDPTLVYEIAERCNISKALARKLLTNFFLEIKKLILEGYEIKIQKLGLFYLATYDMSKTSKRGVAKVLGPKFIPSIWFKQRLAGRDK